MRQKQESPAGKQGQSNCLNKINNLFRNYSRGNGIPSTQRDAYSAIAELRATELRKARKFFWDHPDESYSRADLCELLNLPINHVTRVVYDLMNNGDIEYVGKRINPRSGINVQVLRLTRKEVPNE